MVDLIACPYKDMAAHIVGLEAGELKLDGISQLNVTM